MNLGKPPTEGAYAPDPLAVAHVPSSAPGTVIVDRPAMFDRGDLAHEATHVFQFSRQDPMNEERPGVYDYGGLEGLEKHVASGKTIRDFGVEQQASIVQDYQRVLQTAHFLAQRQGGLTSGQSQYFERHKAAYEPLINQLKNMNPDMGNPSGFKGQVYYNFIPPSANDPRLQPPTPAPPGLPPGNVVGLTGSELMGGGPMRVSTVIKKAAR